MGGRGDIPREDATSHLPSSARNVANCTASEAVKSQLFPHLKFEVVALGRYRMRKCKGVGGGGGGGVGGTAAAQPPGERGGAGQTAGLRWEANTSLLPPHS
ncbi:hypothetical protein KGM_213602 [Danaus plexippus plexippus]|uniref:Uncharacterized protein n=1 Tax=Danaus plexippus plexippus TaxID=278856 RepID=A0A212ENV1_DANPL|nr:hypothetical protein KGM_213602 [Danaus plexippus plexippus]